MERENHNPSGDIPKSLGKTSRMVNVNSATLKSLDLAGSPERRKMRDIYNDTRKSLIEPIDPSSAGRRSLEPLGIDESTYNFVTNQQEGTNSSIELGVVTIQGGSKYQPEEILAEGWLQKKGSGTDWIGSRGWKFRWGRLCWGREIKEAEQGGNSKEGEIRILKGNVRIPMLLLYWFPSSQKVSTAILLESTVVMNVDLEDKSKWNPYRFEVRHTGAMHENGSIDRFFAAPPKARDAWVYAISQTLLEYAKAKDEARKANSSSFMIHHITKSQHLTIFAEEDNDDASAEGKPSPSRWDNGASLDDSSHGSPNIHVPRNEERVSSDNSKLRDIHKTTISSS